MVAGMSCVVDRDTCGWGGWCRGGACREGVSGGAWTLLAHDGGRCSRTAAPCSHPAVSGGGGGVGGGVWTLFAHAGGMLATNVEGRREAPRGDYPPAPGHISPSCVSVSWLSSMKEKNLRVFCPFTRTSVGRKMSGGSGCWCGKVLLIHCSPLGPATLPATVSFHHRSHDVRLPRHSPLSPPRAQRPERNVLFSTCIWFWGVDHLACPHHLRVSLLPGLSQGWVCVAVLR